MDVAEATNTEPRGEKRVRSPSPVPEPPNDQPPPKKRNPKKKIPAPQPPPNNMDVDATPSQPPNLPPPPEQPTDSAENTTQHQAPAEEPTQPPPPNEGIEANVCGTITLASGLTINTAPPGGWPIPELGASVWDNISQEQRLRWPQKPGPKAWVRVFRARYEENAQSTVNRLRDVITKLLGKANTEDLLLSTPMAEEEVFTKYPPPWFFLISGIAEKDIKRLTDLCICASTELTCFFVPYDQPLPTYICTLENFTFPDSQKSNKLIASIVRDAIRTNPEALTYIHSHLKQPDAGAVVRAVDSILVKSLTINVAGNYPQTVWNVYCQHPPDISIEAYYAWTNLIRKLRFISEDYGAAAVRTHDRQFFCLGCKSCDHPTGLCFLQRLPGWLGPPARNANQEEESLFSSIVKSPKKTAKSPDATRGRGNGRQTRGRRGRGRM